MRHSLRARPSHGHSQQMARNALGKKPVVPLRGREPALDSFGSLTCLSTRRIGCCTLIRESYDTLTQCQISSLCKLKQINWNKNFWLEKMVRKYFLLLVFFGGGGGVFRRVPTFFTLMRYIKNFTILQIFFHNKIFIGNISFIPSLRRSGA